MSRLEQFLQALLRGQFDIPYLGGFFSNTISPQIMGFPRNPSFESIRADVIHPVAVAVRDLFGNACGFREIPPFFDGFGNLPDDRHRVLDSVFIGQFFER